MTDGKQTTVDEVEAEEADAASFEDALGRLERIVRELETGELPLEEAFKRFEEGVQLSRRCRTGLEAVEARLAELLEDGTTEDVAEDAAGRTLVPDARTDE